MTKLVESSMGYSCLTKGLKKMLIIIDFQPEAGDDDDVEITDEVNHEASGTSDDLILKSADTL